MIDFSGEEVQGCEDAAVGAEIVLLHYFFVVYRVSNVNIAFKGNVADCWVEVDDVWWFSLGMKMGIYALHECRFAGAWTIKDASVMRLMGTGERYTDLPCLCRQLLPVKPPFCNPPCSSTYEFRG